MSAADCRFYHEFGSGCCDSCGRKRSEHDGMRTLSDWEELPWGLALARLLAPQATEETT